MRARSASGAGIGHASAPRRCASFSWAGSFVFVQVSGDRLSGRWVGSNLRNATEGLVERRTSRGKLASCATFLELPIRRAVGPPAGSRGAPCALGPHESAPSHKRYASCAESGQNPCQEGPSCAETDLSGTDSVRLGAKWITQRGGVESCCPEAHGPSEGQLCGQGARQRDGGNARGGLKRSTPASPPPPPIALL